MRTKLYAHLHRLLGLNRCRNRGVYGDLFSLFIELNKTGSFAQYMSLPFAYVPIRGIQTYELRHTTHSCLNYAELSLTPNMEFFTPTF